MLLYTLDFSAKALSSFIPLTNAHKINVSLNILKAAYVCYVLDLVLRSIGAVDHLAIICIGFVIERPCKRC